MTLSVPEDLATDECRTLLLSAEERVALERMTALLPGDIRFEHLGHHTAEAVRHFVCQCSVDRTQDFVPAFVAQHGRDPIDRLCYLPVESLRVDDEVQVLGLTLLPVSDPQIASARAALRLDPPIASVAVVRVTGTDLGRMAERARDQALEALRHLRVALRQHLSVPDRQLRFRLSHEYSFAGGLSGWEMPAEAGWELALDSELIALAESQAIATLPMTPRTDIERQATLALKWIETALLASEPVLAMLFLFFALEALLGRRNELKKGPGLAYRRALLGLAVGGSFSNPNRTYLLYGVVRSAAVHGSIPPAISWDVLHGFSWDVRTALNEYLDFARHHGYAKRSRLLRALESRDDQPRLVEWLRSHDPNVWNDYFDGSRD